MKKILLFLFCITLYSSTANAALSYYEKERILGEVSKCWFSISTSNELSKKIQFQNFSSSILAGVSFYVRGNGNLVNEPKVMDKFRYLSNANASQKDFLLVAESGVRAIENCMPLSSIPYHVKNKKLKLEFEFELNSKSSVIRILENKLFSSQNEESQLYDYKNLKVELAHAKKIDNYDPLKITEFIDFERDDIMPRNCGGASEMRIDCINKRAANNIVGAKELKNFVTILKKFYQKNGYYCASCDQYLDYIVKLEANPTHHGVAYIKFNKKKPIKEPVGFGYSVGTDASRVSQSAYDKCQSSGKQSQIYSCVRLLTDTQFVYDGLITDVIFDVKAGKAFYKKPGLFSSKQFMSNINVLNQSEVKKQFAKLSVDKNKFVNLEDNFVCARATKSSGLMWETTNPKYTAYIAEARKRKLSLKDCNKLTGRNNGNKPKTSIASTADKVKKSWFDLFTTKPSTEKKIDNTDYVQPPLVPKTSTDKQPPLIEILEKTIVSTSNYNITGQVTDKSKVYIQVDGNDIPVINNKFTINGYLPFGDKELNIVATDQWSNKAKKTIIVQRKIENITDKAIFANLNPSKVRVKQDKNKVAIIIGIEDYENLSNANYAKRDAQFFNDYLQKVFGVPMGNITYLYDKDASYVKTKATLKKWAKRSIRNNSEVYIYFSGHGLATNNGNDLYLLTNDTEPDLVEDSAINRNDIFNDIAKYNPKSVIAFLDTCYSGAGRADGEMLLAMAKGLVVVDEQQQQLPDNFTLFTAASAQESAWSLPEAQHGTFSYFLMKGMEGEADLNNDKKLTNGELQEYLLDNVGRYAQQQQTPQMIGDPNQVLVRF